MKSKTSTLLTLFALASLASACDSPIQKPDEGASKARPEFLETNVILPGTLFATFDPKHGYQAMQAAAKVACGSEAICKVVIFPPETVLPTQFPMTDREVSLEIGNYTLNRNSGADELLASCKIVSGTPKSQCMSVE